MDGSVVKSPSCYYRGFQVQFPAPTRRLTIVSNSNSRGSNAFYQAHKRYMGKTPIHTKKNIHLCIIHSFNTFPTVK